MKDYSNKQELEYENTLSTLKNEVNALTNDLELNKINEREKYEKKLKHRDNEIYINKQELEESKVELNEIITKFKSKEIN